MEDHLSEFDELDATSPSKKVVQAGSKKKKKAGKGVLLDSDRYTFCSINVTLPLQKCYIVHHDLTFMLSSNANLCLDRAICTSLYL